MAKILITGSAGFIGFHLTRALLSRGEEIVGIDNINDYYDPSLKLARLAECGIEEKEIEWHKEVVSHKFSKYKFVRMNLEDKEGLSKLFEDEQFDFVINLAAQAGVRYSIDNPDLYISSNIIGFHNILEGCRHNSIKLLIHASSSSVYGANSKIPFSEDDSTDAPVSLYASTKKSNELMAHSYNYLYDIPIVCLRFFTVYGPWGRPDMAPMLFTNAILKGRPINVFNQGEMERDFTYINDVVNGIVKIIFTDFNDKKEYDIFNIGNGLPINLLTFIKTLEHELGRKAQKIFLPMQPGDVKKTWADTSKLEKRFGYKTNVEVSDGVKKFVEWYKRYYGV
ncbi:NAD-dependent epimerase/dehydratase family protein [Leadbetterella byssophila]|uniref:NAD-dependent epimerase/dehydratase family protein n=1 Tax=Leadbetterella byssophila TaxID=316068 RepID=UPI00399FE830